MVLEIIDQTELYDFSMQPFGSSQPSNQKAKYPVPFAKYDQQLRYKESKRAIELYLEKKTDGIGFIVIMHRNVKWCVNCVIVYKAHRF